MEGSEGVVHAMLILKTMMFLLLGGLVALWATWKLKIPDIAIYLLLGIVLGPAILGVFSVHPDSTINQLLLVFGAATLLFEGGMSIQFKVLKRVIVSVVNLATLGVVVTALITAVATHYLLGLDWLYALLLAAVIASTDPATLVPVFRQVPIRDHVQQTVVTESAFNDATGAILTFSVLGIVMGSSGEFSWGGALGGLLWQAFGGALIGTLLAYAAAYGVSRFDWLKGSEPVLLPLLIAGSYLVATDGVVAIGQLAGMHIEAASGFMAVFCCGLVFGNADALGCEVPDGDLHEMHSFLAHAALMLRMCIFLLLGSQVDFAVLGKYWLPALGVVAVFMLVARPATVLASCLPDRRAGWVKEDLLFMFWTRETGVIPAALAGFLSAALTSRGRDLAASADATAQATGQALLQLGPMISSVTFMAILLTILVQATTTRWLAARLGLLK
ncbi:MAG TPA: sodium:proton antiporter [Azonexus sp.]|nr:sodium:proton antiporter [Azonexus sp.]